MFNLNLLEVCHIFSTETNYDELINRLDRLTITNRNDVACIKGRPSTGVKLGEFLKILFTEFETNHRDFTNERDDDGTFYQNNWVIDEILEPWEVSLTGCTIQYLERINLYNLHKNRKDRGTDIKDVESKKSKLEKDVAILFEKFRSDTAVDVTNVAVRLKYPRGSISTPSSSKWVTYISINKSTWFNR